MNQWWISDFISLKPHYNPLTQSLTALICNLAQCAYLANQSSTSWMFLQSSHNLRCKTTCTGPIDYSVTNCELQIKAGEVYFKHTNTLLWLYFPELKKQNVSCMPSQTIEPQIWNKQCYNCNAIITQFHEQLYKVQWNQRYYTENSSQEQHGF